MVSVCSLVILIVVLVLIQLKRSSIISDTWFDTGIFFHLNQITNLCESNQITTHEFSSQTFAWPDHIPGTVKLRFKSNHNLELPITGTSCDVCVKACRGTDYDDGMETTDSSGGSSRAQRIPIEADFIYAYSTVPGLCHCLCTPCEPWNRASLYLIV